MMSIIADHYVPKGLDISGTDAEIRGLVDTIFNTEVSEEEVNKYYQHGY